jgi:hypothetical protein
MSTRRDKQTQGDLSEILATISLAAKKAREATRSNTKPSIDLVKHGTKLLEAIGSLSKEKFQVAIDLERQAVQSATSEWGEMLKRHCDDKGLLLAGAFPDFIVEGVVYVKFVVNSASASVNGKTLSALPFEPVFKAIGEELEEISHSRKSVDSTIALIWSAYRQVIEEKAEANRLSVKRASILELLPKIALARQSKRFLKNPVREEYVSYSVHHLRADLFALMQADGRLEHNGHCLVLEPTSAAEDGLFMYIPALQRCAYVGHASFVGAGE